MFLKLVAVLLKGHQTVYAMIRRMPRFWRLCKKKLGIVKTQILEIKLFCYINITYFLAHRRMKKANLVLYS